MSHMWALLDSILFHSPLAMAQKSITSFFKPLPPGPDAKRKFSGEAADESSPNKKRVVDEKAALSPVPNNGVNRKNSSNAKIPTYLANYVGPTWYRALQDEFSKAYFVQLTKFVENERKQNTVYPPQDEVFSWTKFTDIQKVKVIILGQDPYHGPNQAHGLAFSVKKGIAQPPSLVNIFKEVKNDYPEFVIPKHGDLTSWAEQGVLLLNACLTVRAHNANSHANKGWEQLTDAVIKYLNQHCTNRVFLLWGAYAQKKGSVIDKKKHLVLKAVHPSPLSAHRGFLGCSHFKSANEYLVKHDLSPIDWTRLN